MRRAAVCAGCFVFGVVLGLVMGRPPAKVPAAIRVTRPGADPVSLSVFATVGPKPKEEVRYLSDPPVAPVWTVTVDGRTMLASEEPTGSPGP